ncbi:hypothetical protein [Catenuloplanes atrovinosus]|uniref:Membrane protein YgcG n=1 Tax=Catenuloplanes atrovinosus TaxID=137266 RepID=A0AAE3YKH3_9ACTN|nr:hypothetical protein [Catenuloplanes atrovinosus]MDR7274187.1 putative membrane protein YgcG [Catenuloplanes atrovinosus]
MGTLLSAVRRLLIGAIFIVVGVFAFGQLGWPYLVSYTYPETTVLVEGPCESGVNQTERLCAASWTRDGAAVTGEIRGVNLETGSAVDARVDGDAAIVIPGTVTLALYCLPLLFVVAGLFLIFSRGGRWSRGGDGGGDDGGWGDSGGGDGGGGGD